MEIILTSTEWTDLTDLSLTEGNTYCFAMSSPINKNFVWRYSIEATPDSKTDGIPIVGNKRLIWKYSSNDKIKADFATTTLPIKITIQEILNNNEGA